MELKFYQEYTGANKEFKQERRLLLLEEGKRALYVNRHVIESMWLSTVELVISHFEEITREEALQEIPELEGFLQHVLPTLSEKFVYYPLTPTSVSQGEMELPGGAP